MRVLIMMMVSFGVMSNEIDSPNYMLLSSMDIRERSEICIVENDNGELEEYKGECTQAKLNLELEGE